MLCSFGKNTKESVLNQFQLNNLVSREPNSSGVYYVLKPEEFDRANREASDMVLSQYNINNRFWVREGNIARFNSTFAQLVDIVAERDGPIEVATVAPMEDGSIELTPDIFKELDEVTDEVLSTRPITKFKITYPDGAYARGVIDGSQARISTIQAPKKGIEAVRGTKTYERVLNSLSQFGPTELVVVMQSADSKAALQKLIDKGVLTNPRNMMGLSDALFPTAFDIAAMMSPGLPTLTKPSNWRSPC